MDATELRSKLERLKGERNSVRQTIASYKTQVRQLVQEREHLEKAREILRTVGHKTQQQLQYHISDVTSLAQQTVFPSPYELKVEFVKRRNKMECDLLFVRNDKAVEPLEASGYGAVDIASFALRVASWSMRMPRTRNVMVLDEPFKNLSRDHQPAAGQMLKEISKKLGIQFIIVTHEVALSEEADALFHVQLKNGVSNVTKK